MPTINRQRNFAFSLKDVATHESIQGSGGVAFICDAGTPDLATLFNVDTGASLSNPITLNQGHGDFAVAEATTSVDVYILSPTGHFVVHEALGAQEFAEIYVDTMRRDELAVVPFSYASDVNSEHDTGLNFPLGAEIMADGIGIEVTAVDATETLDVGLLSTETNGDADGLVDGLSVATSGFVNAGPVITVGSNEQYLSACTLGALLRTFLAGSDVATDVGTFFAKNHIVQGSNAVSLTWLLSAGSDTAKGFIHVPYRLREYPGT